MIAVALAGCSSGGGDEPADKAAADEAGEAGADELPGQEEAEHHPDDVPDQSDEQNVDRPQLDGQRIPAPASGNPELPSWNVGSFWSYGDGQGTLRNMTVEAIEEKEGIMSYRVRMEESPPSQEVPGARKVWVNQENLGVVAFQVGDESYPTGCPMGGTFPMEDGSRTCQTQTPFGEVTVRETRSLGGWYSMDSPKGKITALQVNFSTEGRQSSTWYSPEVQNRAAFDEGSKMWVVVDWILT